MSSKKKNVVVPKLCGADCELGNFVYDEAGAEAKSAPTGWAYSVGTEAASLLLAEVSAPHHKATAEITEINACNCSVHLSQRAAAAPKSPYLRSLVGGKKKKQHRGSGRWNTATRSYDTDQASGSHYDGGGYSNISYGSYGRKFLAANGGCIYIDMGHLELCIPEVLSAKDHVAAWHAMLSIANDARVEANKKLADTGKRVDVLVNNSDGMGNSYGSHQNFLITKELFNNIFDRRPYYLSYLASFQASSIIYTGAGKVSSENYEAKVPFQLSQRADFFECMVGSQTTSNRPIVNSRNESLCGGSVWAGRASGYWDYDLKRWVETPKEPEEETPKPAYSRLHVIFFDNNLQQTACYLKVGTMQIVLAMMEAGLVNPNLILEDPLEAVKVWSKDPTLQATARTANGEEITAIEHQSRFLSEAAELYDALRGVGVDSIIPGFNDICVRWSNILDSLEEGDLEKLALHLDWALKLRIMEHQAERNPERFNWDTGIKEFKYIDHMYSNLDPQRGFYWLFAGRYGEKFVSVVSPAEIERFKREPPKDTRAWGRAQILRRAGSGQLSSADWDEVRVYAPNYKRVDLHDPFSFTETNHSQEFAELLETLGGEEV